jgi:hypothetical protein
MIVERKKEYMSTLSGMLTSADTKNCIKKEVIIGTGARISPFDVRQFSPKGTLTPGLYILSLADMSDGAPFEQFVSPRVFSLIDSSITMKTDTSGKISFLVTDIKTGKPRSNQ